MTLQARELLFNISTPAPAWQHLPPAVYGTIDGILETGALELNAETAQVFLERAPALLKLLKDCPQPLAPEVLELLKQLKAASERPFAGGSPCFCGHPMPMLPFFGNVVSQRATLMRYCAPVCRCPGGGGGRCGGERRWCVVARLDATTTSR